MYVFVLLVKLLFFAYSLFLSRGFSPSSSFSLFPLLLSFSLLPLHFLFPGLAGWTHHRSQLTWYRRRLRALLPPAGSLPRVHTRDRSGGERASERSQWTLRLADRAGPFGGFGDRRLERPHQRGLGRPPWADRDAHPAVEGCLGSAQILLRLSGQKAVIDPDGLRMWGSSPANNCPSSVTALGSESWMLNKLASKAKSMQRAPLLPVMRALSWRDSSAREIALGPLKRDCNLTPALKVPTQDIDRSVGADFGSAKWLQPVLGSLSFTGASLLVGVG